MSNGGNSQSASSGTTATNATTAAGTTVSAGTALSRTFNRYCTGCHGTDGKLRDDADLTAAARNPDDFKMAVRQGRSFMMSFPSSLYSDADLSNDISYLAQH
jgi:mono/diheme cytochrome c family protein